MRTARTVIPLLLWLLVANDSYAQSEYGFGVEETASNLMLPMRDGVSLATDVYRPTRVGAPVDEQLPILLQRTPYDKTGERIAENSIMHSADRPSPIVLPIIPANRRPPSWVVTSGSISWHAALLNGITSHVLDYDDTHLDTIIHPAGPVASGLLALAEKHDVSGEDFMHAFILGVEAECRIGLAVYPSHYERGFHITGTAGVFGSAVACGKLLGLNEQQMIWAMGIAATQSAGLKEMFGTMCKSFHVGSAGQNGLKAALLAAKNYTSSPGVLEAKEGFAFTYSDEQDFSQITDDLGARWETDKNTYKPFSCGIVTHPIIDGCIQLRIDHTLTAEQIEKVSLRVNPLVIKLTGKKTPQTGLEAKFSIFYISAAAIVTGVAGPNQFTDEAVRMPEVVALRDRVEATVDEDVSEEEAFVSITLRDGTVHSTHIENAIGSVQRPLTKEHLEQKFADQAQTALPMSQIVEVMALCWEVENLDSVGEVAWASAAV